MRHVSDLVLKGIMRDEAVSDVVAAGLAGYAVERIASGDAGAAAGQTDGIDPRLQRSRLANSVRHATVRRIVADLITAWHDAGYDSLILKGFYLAEFVYPSPTWRPYSDVDIALRGRAGTDPATTAMAAADIAVEHGWELLWRFGEEPSVHSHHDADYNGHELLLLRHAALGIGLDVHRRLVHSNVTSWRVDAKSEELTTRVWAAAQPLRLLDAEAFAPSFTDSLLVGLIAGRSWSGDRYVLRPHDVLDMKYLMQRGQVDKEALLERAAELRMVRTARLFLRRCDPVAGTLDLRTPTAVETFWYDTYLMSERGHRGLQRFGNDLATFPARVSAILGELPHVRRLTHASGQDPGASTAVVPSAPDRGSAGKALDKRTWRRTQQAVRRALQLAGKRPEGDPAFTLECAQHALLRRGFRVALLSSGTQPRLVYQGSPLHAGVLLGETLAAAHALPHGPHGEARVLPSHAVPAHAPGARWLRLLSRARAAGVGGLALRLEALVYLWRIRRRLRSTTFIEVRDDLLDKNGTRAPGAGEARVAGAMTQDVGRTSTSTTVPDAAAVGRAVESAARFLPGARCVAQSLAGQVMLSRRDVHSTIHFGFLRSAAGSVTGHAWLEVDGAVVTGDVGLDGFTRTATFSA